MKAKMCLSALKNIVGRKTLGSYRCHCQLLSKSNFFLDKADQLRLISHLRYNDITIETEKLLNKPEIQNYLKLISDEFEKLDRSENPVTPAIAICNKIKKYKNDLKNLQTLHSENDKEMQKLIHAEEKNFGDEIRRLSSELVTYAIPNDNESNSVIFSVIPGLGGQEAKLFAEELFQMYLNYAEYKKWEISHVEQLTAEGGGIMRAEATISGDSVFRLLKHEAGIHRVQRVPTTEKYGKVQTSTCKINVIPDMAINEIVLNNKDLKVDTKRSSAPGGQNVNKLETCVRVTHIPTGLVTECQMERTQKANKDLALKKLKNLLYQMQQEEISSKTDDIKSEQGLTIKRSDKIRTYNFVQNRVTDHRINYTTRHLEKYMEGNKILDEMVLQVDANFQEEYLIRNINRMVRQKNVSEVFKRNENKT